MRGRPGPRRAARGVAQPPGPGVIPAALFQPAELRVQIPSAPGVGSPGPARPGGDMMARTDPPPSWASGQRPPGDRQSPTMPAISNPSAPEAPPAPFVPPISREELARRNAAAIALL